MVKEVTMNWHFLKGDPKDLPDKEGYYTAIIYNKTFDEYSIENNVKYDAAANDWMIFEGIDIHPADQGYSYITNWKHLEVFAWTSYLDVKDLLIRKETWAV